MILFKTRLPRSYRPRHIYTDERKDKLQRLVNDVKREQGEKVDEPYDTNRFKGQFSKYTPHATRARETMAKIPWPIAILLIFVMLFLWRYLLRGSLH